MAALNFKCQIRNQLSNMLLLTSNLKLLKRLVNHNVLRFISISTKSNNFQKINTNKDSRDNQDDIPNHVDLTICPFWDSCNENIVSIKSDLLRGMLVIPDFINEDEENILYTELQTYLKKMRYEFDCWDNAIHGFRETEKTQWKDPKVGEIVEKAQKKSILPPNKPLAHTHILDLDAKGYIKPHVDSVRFCGTTVAGMCLLSPAVMRLRHCNETELFADFLLSQRCLYIMKDSARYNYTHEILPQETSFFKGESVVRTRRISVISRTEVVNS